MNHSVMFAILLFMALLFGSIYGKKTERLSTA